MRRGAARWTFSGSLLRDAAERCAMQNTVLSIGFDSLRSFYVDNDEALHEVYLVAKAELNVYIFSFLYDCHGRWLGSRLGQLFMFLTLYLFIV